jgi:hypothetical protein
MVMAVLLGLPFLQPRYVSDESGQISLPVLILIQFGLSRLLEDTTGVKYRAFCCGRTLRSVTTSGKGERFRDDRP